jgi:hypothetical protein
VTVIGSSDCGFVEEAYRLGKFIAQRGWVLISGGRGGVMESASKGAHEGGGLVVGILPFDAHHQANPYCDIVIPTGIGYARNLVNVLAGDVVVAMGGKSGTLSEIAYAWQFGRPIIACSFLGGWSEQIAGRPLDDRDGKIFEAKHIDVVFDLLDAIIKDVML